MTEALKDKLKTLPNEPGVYFHRDQNKKIIYIGKAAVLKNRVMSYFQQSRHRDSKTRLLVNEIFDTEWIVVGSEVEALFLESEFIKRYKPKYNVDWKDEKNYLYVKISADDFPVMSYVRRPMDDKANYYGPFTSIDALKRAMRYLRKVFPYVTHENWPPRACLQAHLGLCPNPEEGAISGVEYRRDIRRLEMYLKGDQGKLIQQIERDMERAAKKKDFEAAAHYRDQLRDLRALGKQMIFGDREAFDLSRDQALVGLAERLGLPGAPRRIEAYDISHLQGQDNVASMVVFTDGVPNRDEYRRFKMRLRGNDDFAHMREVISRRFNEKNLSEWAKPDLILIDGGKGQLGAALSVLDERGIHIPAIGLAKREEEIIRRREDIASKSERNVAHEMSEHPENLPILPTARWDDEAWVMQSEHFEIIVLPRDSHVLHLLQRVRDEAHRFAITYQTVLRGKRQIKSQLDEIPGIGPVTRKALVKKFGSVKGVMQAKEAEIAAVIGPAKAQVLLEHLRPQPSEDPALD
jgi:excinuclease ABC subunit C